MKNKLILALAVFALGSGAFLNAADAPKKEKMSAAEIEKQKALADPYANDLGPAEIDELVKDYPKDKLEGYKLLKVRCAQCHQPSRPLNSQFIETEGKSMEEREASLGKVKKAHPDWFGKNKNVFQVEADIWQRYVKRMMAKPGCNISKDEGKKIWDFLAYDSNARKLKDPEAWKKHREGLLKEFKEKHPKRYEELYAPSEKGDKSEKSEH